jgi:hypothetical protein
MGDSIAWLVMVLSEDPTIVSFEARKAALRAQASREAAETRMDTSVVSMADHYRDSVQMIADVRPDSVFLSALRLGLGRLDAATTSSQYPFPL